MSNTKGSWVVTDPAASRPHQRTEIGQDPKSRQTGALNPCWKEGHKMMGPACILIVFAAMTPDLSQHDELEVKRFECSWTKKSGAPRCMHCVFRL